MKDHQFCGKYHFLPVLIFSVLAHSVFSPVANAFFFDGIQWNKATGDSQFGHSESKPYNAPSDAFFSKDVATFSLSEGYKFSDDSSTKPEDKKDDRFKNCTTEILHSFELHQCPHGPAATQKLYEGFFENATGDVCLHLREMDQDTKSVTFLVILLSNGCNSSAYAVATNVTNLTSNMEDEVLDGEQSVRKLLSQVNNSKMVLEFDVMMSASQMAQHYDTDGLDKMSNWLKELDLSQEEKENFTAIILSHGDEHSRISRSSCVDRIEQKIYNVVEYIPLIGELWGLGSTIGYAATKCNDAAKERGIDLAIGIALDIATVATLGSGAAAFQGIKVGIKAGMKYGVRVALKSGLKASGTVFKRLAVKSLKGSKQWLKHPLKSMITDVGNTFRGLKNIPKAVRNIPKALKHTTKRLTKYVDEVAQLRKTRKAIQRKLKNADLYESKWKYEVYTPKTKQEVWHQNQKTKFVYTKAELESDPVWKSIRGNNKFEESPGLQGVSVGLCRMKRTGSKKAKYCDVHDIKYLNEKINKKIKDMLQKVETPDQRVFKLDLVNTHIGEASTKDIPNKYIFKRLQHYTEFAPLRSTSNSGKKMTVKADLEVTMEIGGKPRMFVLKDSTATRKYTYDQIFVKTNTKNYPGTKGSLTYEQFIKNLEGTDGLGKERAQQILAAIEETPKRQVKWDELTINGKKLFSEQQERTAVEFIAVTQIAESAISSQKSIIKDGKEIIKQIGRNPGTDKWARQLLRDIGDKDLDTTWRKAFNNKDGIFLPAQRGGTQKTRDLFNGQHPRDKQSDLRARSLKDMSDDSEPEKYFSG